MVERLQSELKFLLTILHARMRFEVLVALKTK